MLAENPLLSLVEFKDRSEIKVLREYKKFVGRESEIKELCNFNFLDKYKRIMLVTGRGGTVKTRLVIEFAEQIKDKNWEVYFIHPEIEFKPMMLPGTKNIFSFLIKNFEIEKDFAREIEKKCGESIVLAELYATSYKEKKKIGKQIEVIEHRLAKYTRSITEQIEIPNRISRRILSILSLITPVRLDEDRDLLRAFYRWICILTWKIQ